MALSASHELTADAAALVCRRVVLLVDAHRLDVAVPAHVPVAEVLPDLVAVVSQAVVPVAPGAVLLRLGGGELDEALSLQEHHVSEGEILVLQPKPSPVPLRVQHDLTEAVRVGVGAQFRDVDVSLRRGAHLSAVGLVGVALAGLAAATPGAGIGIVGGGAAAAVAGLYWSGRAGAGRMAAVMAGLVVLHLTLLGHLGVSVIPQVGWPAGSGAVLGLVVSGLVLLWAPVGLREWAVTPFSLAAALCAATGIMLWTRGTTVELAPSVAMAAAVIGAVMLAGPLRALVVDLVLVRRVPPSGAAVQPSDVAGRLGSATRVLLALDVATVVLACMVVPQTLTRGASGVMLWGALVGVLLLRTRGETLAVRAVVNWAGAALVTMWGLIAIISVQVLWGGESLEGAVLGCVAVASLVSAACVRGALGLAGSIWSARALTLTERLLRVALPSLWLLHSGLLPGGAA